jgi:DNA-binding NtrC family response regulator
MNRPKLATMCNELSTVRAITAAVSSGFELALAGDAQTLQHILSKDPTPVAVMIDIATVQVDAIKMLETVRKECPAARRILLTDFCDLRIIVQGLHTGAIQRIVYKPIYQPELLGALGVQPAAMPPIHAGMMQQARIAG